MTQILSITNTKHLDYASKLIAQGEIIVAGFNGIYGIFGDADCSKAAGKILTAKNRPADKNLILVSPPEFLIEFVDIESNSFKYHSFDKIVRLYREIFALGVILPAAIPGSPSHLVRDGTILNIWTEYPPYHPLRNLVLNLKKRGKRALVGTSANKSGCPTYVNESQVIEAFNGSVAAILTDSFEHLPSVRRKSTTVLDCTKKQLRLHRAGSVPEDELREHLRRLGFYELIIGQDTIKVRGYEPTCSFEIHNPADGISINYTT